MRYKEFHKNCESPSPIEALQQKDFEHREVHKDSNLRHHRQLVRKDHEHLVHDEHFQLEQHKEAISNFGVSVQKDQQEDDNELKNSEKNEMDHREQLEERSQSHDYLHQERDVKSTSSIPQTLPREQRNDKDPLFFVPKPRCSECLKELQWSKQFVAPFHRSPIHLSSVVSSYARRRTAALWPVGDQTIRKSQRHFEPSSTAIEEPLTLSVGLTRKREKVNYLHQIQMVKSSLKRRLRKSSNRHKLVDVVAKMRNLSRGDSKVILTVNPSVNILENLLILSKNSYKMTSHRASLSANKGANSIGRKYPIRTTMSPPLLSSVEMGLAKSFVAEKHTLSSALGPVSPLKGTINDKQVDNEIISEIASGSILIPTQRQTQTEADDKTVSTSTTSAIKSTPMAMRPVLAKISGPNNWVKLVIGSPPPQISGTSFPIRFDAQSVNETKSPKQIEKGAGSESSRRRNKPKSNRLDRLDESVAKFPENDLPWMPRMIKTRSPHEVSSHSYFVYNSKSFA